MAMLRGRCGSARTRLTVKIYEEIPSAKRLAQSNARH